MRHAGSSACPQSSYPDDSIPCHKHCARPHSRDPNTCPRQHSQRRNRPMLPVSPADQWPVRSALRSHLCASSMHPFARPHARRRAQTFQCPRQLLQCRPKRKAPRGLPQRRRSFHRSDRPRLPTPACTGLGTPRPAHGRLRTRLSQLVRLGSRRSRRDRPSPAAPVAILPRRPPALPPSPLLAAALLPLCAPSAAPGSAERAPRSSCRRTCQWLGLSHPSVSKCRAASVCAELRPALALFSQPPHSGALPPCAQPANFPSWPASLRRFRRAYDKRVCSTWRRRMAID